MSCVCVCVSVWEKLQFNFVLFFYLTQENCLLGLMEFEIVFLLVGNSFCFYFLVRRRTRRGER